MLTLSTYNFQLTNIVLQQVFGRDSQSRAMPLQRQGDVYFSDNMRQSEEHQTVRYIFCKGRDIYNTKICAPLIIAPCIKKSNAEHVQLYISFIAYTYGSGLQLG